MLSGELGLGRLLRPQLSLNFAAATPPGGGTPRGFDTAPIPDYRRMVAEREAELIMARNDRLATEIASLNPAATDYETRRNALRAAEQEDVLHLIQPHMPDRAYATATEASPMAQHTAHVIGNINIIKQRDLEHARTHITDPALQLQELTAIQASRRAEIADELSYQMIEPVMPKPAKAPKPPRGRAPAPDPRAAAPAPAPAWPGAGAVDTTRSYVVNHYHQDVMADDHGRRFGCGVVSGLALAAVLGGTIALASGWHPFGGGGGSPSPTPTPTHTSGEAGPISIASNTCLDVPANAVIMGDVNVGGHMENGQIVGGRNLYDTGPGSDQTGLVTVTTAPQTICAEWGASGQSFTTLDDAKKKAGSDKSNMEANGCGSGGCRRGVTIIYVP